MSKGESANTTYNFANAVCNIEHKLNDFANTTHSIIEATKIDMKSAIFAHVMSELKHTNGFLDA